MLSGLHRMGYVGVWQGLYAQTLRGFGVCMGGKVGKGVAGVTVWMVAAEIAEAQGSGLLCHHDA